ncbi:small multi-drug export protein [Jeotgalibacillus terrae]|uniref:Small multi-drug export protein n=1 Tax=Jeotgalibacillus terrae TaxID=587735 RepID=A0ABW5ZKY5_9BACL|nr:small multi-drug export protein [Jeotgalibacillus terrae]MBM7578895.1 putative membrane protein [Jeotgalibacillus terrae]
MPIVEYALLFLAAATPWLEIALVIPLGILRGLSPFWVMVTGFAGNLLTVFLLIVLFQKVKEYLAKRKEKSEGKKEGKRQTRARNIWNKYGLPGLSLLGPILIGTHIAAFIALTLGADKTRVLIWQVISIALWTLAFGYAAVFGVDFLINA